MAVSRLLVFELLGEDLDLQAPEITQPAAQQGWLGAPIPTLSVYIIFIEERMLLGQASFLGSRVEACVFQCFAN